MLNMIVNMIRSECTWGWGGLDANAIVYSATGAIESVAFLLGAAYLFAGSTPDAKTVIGFYPYGRFYF